MDDEESRMENHPLDCLHINKGSLDAASDAYEEEHLGNQILEAINRLERTASGHYIGADKADDMNGYQGGFAAGFQSCLNGLKHALEPQIKAALAKARGE